MNKLEVERDKRISDVIARYDTAVFILGGGTTKKATKLYGLYGPADVTRTMCKTAYPDLYDVLKRYNCKGVYTEPTIKLLRANKHLFFVAV